MKLARIGSVAVAAAALQFAASAADWPHFLGPNNNSHSSETGINKKWNSRKPRKLWQVSLGDRGFAGPSVAKSMVFIVDHEGSKDIVRAIDLNSGTDKWRYSYEATSKANYGFARATPAYDSGKLYTFSREGELNCLDATRGRKLWTVNIQRTYSGRKPRWGYTSSPMIDGQLLIMCPGGSNAAVVALDKNTGKAVWRGGGSDAPGYAMPVAAKLQGRSQYVIFSAKAVLGVDARSGRTLWRSAWHTTYDVNAATPLVIGSNVFVTSNYGRGCGMVTVNSRGATIAWENKSIQSHFNSPILHDNYIYSTSDRGKIVCMDPRSGSVKWEKKGFGKGGMIAIDGTLIVLDAKSGDCAMIEINPNRYNELGRMKPLGGKSWTAPIVADGKLIVRNESAMACFDLK